jgi:AraC-like DNA-binding protein
MIRIDHEQLDRLLRDFHLLTGFRIGIFDCAGHELSSWPHGLSSFCASLRAWPDAARRCAACDREAFDKAAETGCFLTYRCHAGLVEALTPLIQNGRQMGYLMIGQMVSRQPGQDPWKYTEQAIASAGADPAVLRPLFDRLGALDATQVRAAFSILEISAQHLLINDIIRNDHPSPEEKLRLALRNNQQRRVTVTRLARETETSRTSLYKLAHQTLGQPIGKHIRSVRLAEAERLLVETDMTIASIAESLDLQNTSYFSRWFRQCTGMTPSAFRQAHSSPTLE